MGNENRALSLRNTVNCAGGAAGVKPLDFRSRSEDIDLVVPALSSSGRCAC